jgi:hypothetical protein
VLSGARLEDGRRWRYPGARPVAGHRGSRRDIHRLEPAQEQGCDASGVVIPFARTKAERRASDPRLSVEERHPDHASYVRAVNASAHDLENRRLLFRQHAERYIRAAEDGDVE